MDETKITAKLPNLDVEITRRDLPEQNAETITLRMTATPSFDIDAGLLMQPSNLPVLTGAAWMGPWVDAWVSWTRLAQSVWTPWLEPMMPRLEQRSEDGEDG
ncbi:MAG: hypothetical protein R3293_24020 [Candidatus Promineifilaceae bacterium]|nr:hypothetical protein [Candidatus Promineifilaceae bacterium]